MSSLPREPICYTQNFLTNPRLIAHLLDQSSLTRDDMVYEIGPGKGSITAQLAQRCQRVVAIEKDPRLAALLLQRFAGWPQVSIQRADFLDYPLPRQPYKVFANIPFNITSAIVAKLASAANPPDDAYLAMQREAAALLLGQPRESLRALLLKPWFEVEVVHRFQRSDFAPEPQVDVVMLRLRKRGPPLVSQQERQRFRDFVVYAFTMPQPSLPGTLKTLLSGPQIKHISRAVGFAADATPTALTFAQWLRLFACFQQQASAQALRAIAGSEQRLLRRQQRLQKIHRTRLE
jgi:23S rRNA (adenine-N6)-dimethyltransferase